MTRHLSDNARFFAGFFALGFVMLGGIGFSSVQAQPNNQSQAQTAPDRIQLPLNVAVGDRFKAISEIEFEDAGVRSKGRSELIFTVEEALENGQYRWIEISVDTSYSTLVYKSPTLTDPQKDALKQLILKVIDSTKGEPIGFISDKAGYPIALANKAAFIENKKNTKQKFADDPDIKALFDKAFEKGDLVKQSVLNNIFDPDITPKSDLALIENTFGMNRDLMRTNSANLFRRGSTNFTITDYVRGFDNGFEMKATLQPLNTDAVTEPLRVSYVQRYTPQQLERIKSALTGYVKQNNPNLTPAQLAEVMGKAADIQYELKATIDYDRKTGMPVYYNAVEISNHYDDVTVQKLSVTVTPMDD